MEYIDYMKRNKKHITQEELNNWIYFGAGDEDDYRFFADKINWEIALEQHQFSEAFIRENVKYMNLKTVFLTQNVSNDFKREFHIEKYIPEEEIEEYELMAEHREFGKVLGQFEQLGKMFSQLC